MSCLQGLEGRGDGSLPFRFDHSDVAGSSQTISVRRCVTLCRVFYAFLYFACPIITPLSVSHFASRVSFCMISDPGKSDRFVNIYSRLRKNLKDVKDVLIEGFNNKLWDAQLYCVIRKDHWGSVICRTIISYNATLQSGLISSNPSRSRT